MTHFMRLHRRSLPTAVFAGLVVLACLSSSGLALAATGSGPGKGPSAGPIVPKASRTFTAAIEGLAPYQPETFCRHRVEPGVIDFAKLLTSTYPKTAIVSELRPCGSEPAPSEHMDGRALDWGVDHRNAADRQDGNELLSWLFATDSFGNKDAMLRRLGIMYIIWNKRIWGTWDQQWEPYSCSGVTACHVDHMHFSFGWAGAEAKTSWFSGQVSPVLPPPYPLLRSFTKTDAFTVAADSDVTQGQFLLGRHLTYSVTVSGTWRRGKGKHQLSDAVCQQQSDGTWVPNHSLSFDGSTAWTSTNSDETPCNLDSHTYVMTVTPTAKTQPGAGIDITGASKPSGDLTIAVKRTK